jgi:arsenate reductase
VTFVMPPDIRSGTEHDRGAVIGLLQQAGLPVADLRGSTGARFWIARDEGRVIGAIGLERHGTDGLLRSLVVAPALRRHGIGALLVAALEAAARAEGIENLVLLTQTAETFFRRLGYSAVPRDAAPDTVKDSTEFRSLCPASAVCMVKSLKAAAPLAGPGMPSRVLFLCTGNSCRSILGEATFNHLAPAGWRAMSAGSKPTGLVHPRSLALLAREGIATDGYHSKSWDGLPHTPDIVVTVCSSAAGETCPAYLGPVLRTHWGVEDPAHATGTDEQVEAAFAAAYRTLRRRIEAFLALPLDELRNDPARLKAEMDRIGTQVS